MALDAAGAGQRAKSDSVEVRVLLSAGAPSGAYEASCPDVVRRRRYSWQLRTKRQQMRRGPRA